MRGFAAWLGNGFGWGCRLRGFAAWLDDGFGWGYGLRRFVAGLSDDFCLGCGWRGFVARLGQGYGAGAPDNSYGDAARSQRHAGGVRHGFFMAVGMWCCRYARFCINP